MALIDPKEITKADIPNEPGEWVRYRVLTLADAEKLDKVTTSALIAAAIVEWSYKLPPTLETIRTRLDMTTAYWLGNLINESSGLRTDPEDNGSESQSSPTSEPAAGSSQKNSGI